MRRGYQEASHRTNRLFSITFLYLCGLTNEEEKRLKDGKQKIFLSWGFLLVSFSFFLAKAQAQIVPDATMPVNSIITPQGSPVAGESFVIQGGTRAGGNLFHSFQEFSVPTGGEAFFNNALDVQNIFSRVTGRSISNIDGLIRANGAANLFLLNPNGIIFGPNAQLNIGGSFLATTANSFKFADGTEFSTTTPQTPPLLTISVPVGLQMGPNPGNIVVQGPGHNLTYNPFTFVINRGNQPVGLQVAPGQTLALLGGNVAIEGGNLIAEGGRIELGSVGGETLVTLTPMNPGIALSYPGTENFQDISLSQVASVDTSGAGGGDVFVTGRRVTLTDGSAILDLTEGAEPGGTLSIRASQVVEAIGTTPNSQFPSGLFTSVQRGATGDGGNLTIETASLRVTTGAVVVTGTVGSGKAGNLTIKATDTVEVIGPSPNVLVPSALVTSIAPEATGNGGNLTIETARLRVTTGAVVSTATFSSGKAGDLTVKATDSVELIDGSNGLFNSGLVASIERGAKGDGGNLSIETARLRVADGSVVSTGTSGPGNAGNLTVKAADTVELSGESSLTASVGQGATGDGGDLNIETARLRVAHGAQISTGTLGAGNGGNLTVKATEAVEVIGTSADGELPSGLFVSAEPGATGSGGNLRIETSSLRVADGAVVSTGTFGSGKAGNLTVKATEAVEVIGVSSLTASVGQGATGDGGDLNIETARLRVAEGADVSASTFGSGKAGILTVKATNTVELIGTSADGVFPSGLFASAEPGATGDGGNLNIETSSLQVADGAEVSVSSFAEGKAGSLLVNAGSIRLDNLSNLAANTKAGGGDIELRSPSITLRRDSSITTNATGGESGGDIKMRTGFLQLRDGSRITTNAEGENVIGGNITLNSDIIVGLENSDITANSINSSGGNVTINTKAIFGLQTRTREELQRLLNTDDPTLLDPKNLPTGDITATGANSSLSGTLAINTPEVNPSAGLVDLPANPVDATALVASTCRRRGEEQGEFIFTGRGGLPPSPNELIRNEATWMDLREITLAEGKPANQQTSKPAGENGELANSKSSIVEAQGWLKNSQGQVVLVAETATATPQNSTFTPEYCNE